MKLGRPQAALRYQTLLAQMEMEGRASARVYLANLPKEASVEKVASSIPLKPISFFYNSDSNMYLILLILLNKPN